jgi:rhodanese-related sulfurtransferase
MNRADLRLLALSLALLLGSCTNPDLNPAPTPEPHPTRPSPTTAPAPTQKATVITQPSPALEGIKRSTATDYPDVSHVSPATVAVWQEEATAGGTPLILLDVREPDEFAVSSLLGARQVAPDAAASSLVDLTSSSEARIVCYCSVGVRSAILTKRLQQAGFTNVSNMNGSIFEWASTGRPVYQGDRQVGRVHPYNEKWGRLLREDLRSYDP